MCSRLASFAVLSLSFLAACGQAGFEVGSEEELGSTSQAMLDGELSDESFGGVVFLETLQATGDPLGCTGTLIAPNLVATALHCVTSEDLGDFGCQPDGTLSTSSNALEGTLGPLVAPGNVKIYAGSPVRYGEVAAVGERLFGTGSTQACQGDLALVVLDRNLDLPSVAVRLDRQAAWQEDVNVLGYGQTGDRIDHRGMRIIRQVEVLDVGPATTTEPTRTTPPRTFVVGHGPCKGDSGGPALSQETGALLGVFSLNTAKSCDEVGIRNVYTSLSPFSKLVLDAYAAAGVEPNLENGLAVEPEPVKSTEVADSGCALAAPRSTTPWAFAALGLAVSGLWARRRRTRA
ncbi:MAG: hypothetical protein RL685_6092 [Pseudomonadota bacterium]|jgi:hypothetical protein